MHCILLILLLLLLLLLLLILTIIIFFLRSTTLDGFWFAQAILAIFACLKHSFSNPVHL
jgi:hypothetical protein